MIWILLGTALLCLQCTNRQNQPDTEEAEGQQWTKQFDISGTDNWRDTKSENFPEHGWVLDGDILTVLGEKEGQPGGHDIITKKRYGNFELELEVRLTEGANSGIKYLVTDALNGRDGNHKMASLYDMIAPPEDLNIQPPGKWNKVSIILDGNKVEHWLNDEKVLESDRRSEAFRELVSMSKYQDLERFGELDEGHLLLQGHGNDVSFRKIRIRTW